MLSGTLLIWIFLEKQRHPYQKILPVMKVVFKSSEIMPVLHGEDSRFLRRAGSFLVVGDVERSVLLVIFSTNIHSFIKSIVKGTAALQYHRRSSGEKLCRNEGH